MQLAAAARHHYSRAVSPDESQLADQLKSLRIERPAGGRSYTTSGEGGARLPRWLLAVLALALLGVGGYFFFNQTESTFFPEEIELGAVTLVSPSQEDVTLVATGYVYSRKRATVAPKTSGRLARLFVDEGFHVKENQVIAELESAEAEAQMAQVRAEVAAARARTERARADLAQIDTQLQRDQKLADSAAGTQAAVDDTRARHRVGKAQLDAAEAEAAAVAARQQIAAIAFENTRVRAPFAGTVIRKLGEVGEVIALGLSASGGSAGLVTIASLSDLEVQADVSESQLSKVKLGTPAEILLDAFPDRRFRAEVQEIRQLVDRAKASVTVKVRFKDDVHGVLPDMAAKVSFLARPLDEAAMKVAPKLVAPPDAIVSRGGRKVVFTVEDGRAREIPVVAGGAVGNMIELTSGPVSNTRIIRRPTDKVKDGAAVKEKEKGK